MFKDNSSQPRSRCSLKLSEAGFFLCRLSHDVQFEPRLMLREETREEGEETREEGEERRKKGEGRREGRKIDCG